MEGNLYEEYLGALGEAISGLPLDQIHRAAEIIFSAYREERTIFTFGNGGSAALASHIGADLGKATHIPGPQEVAKLPRLKVLSLADNSPMITAWANDFAYEHVFSAQMENFISKGDVALGISGSGNSPNVLRALELARRMGTTTVGLTGCGGGKMKALLDCMVLVPSGSMQIVEDAHVITSHLLLIDLRRRLAELAGNGDVRK